MARSRMILAVGVCLLAVGFVVTGLVVMVVGGEPGSRGYVVRDEAGQLVIGYRSCPGEAVAEVAVTDRTVSPAATVWEVSRSGYTHTTEFTLGQVPAGFDEVRRFVRPAESHTLRFDLTSTAGGSDTVEFQLDRLHAGEFWDGGESQPSPVSKLDRTFGKYC